MADAAGQGAGAHDGDAGSRRARDARRRLTNARRVVVKIGSKSLAGDAWDRLAAEVRAAREGERSLVIVSSGAIALGIEKLGFAARPKDMARLQAAAAAGQSVLMQRYEEAFGKVGLLVAQVLLTHADLADRTRANNARSALAALLAAGAVPIINENDAVAVEEIKFGDNDQLASMVAPLCDADLLLLLSDVEGLLDRRGQRVPFVENVAKEARPLASGATSGVGTGGMTSKVEAARRATLAGADVVIAAARTPNILGRILAGEDLGTLFAAAQQKLSARKYWIAYTLRPQGALLLDRGATDAVLHKGRSVLPVGVLGVRGRFHPGDSVSLVGAEGTEVGRGLVRVSAAEAAAMAGQGASAGSGEGRRAPRSPVVSERKSDKEEALVHRDDLVVLPAD